MAAAMRSGASLVIVREKWSFADFTFEDDRCQAGDEDCCAPARALRRASSEPSLSPLGHHATKELRYMVGSPARGSCGEGGRGGEQAPEPSSQSPWSASSASSEWPGTPEPLTPWRSGPESDAESVSTAASDGSQRAKAVASGARKAEELRARQPWGLGGPAREAPAERDPALHPNGVCIKPCLFAFTEEGCRSGAGCRFCHQCEGRSRSVHARWAKTRPCKERRGRYRKLVQHLMQQVEQDPQGFDMASVELPSSVLRSQVTRRKLATKLSSHLQLVRLERLG